jgi:hypothetical protein
MVYLQEKPFTKKMVEATLSEIKGPMSIDDIPEEKDSHYISTSFNKDGTLSATTYWESELCKKGCPYLVHHLGICFLLLPDNDELDDGVALSIYITRGTYQGEKDCL